MEFPDKYDTTADYMTAESSDLLTMTSSDKTTPEHSKGDNEDMDDIVKALTDFSAGNNDGETDESSQAMLENNVVTISYTQTVRFSLLYLTTKFQCLVFVEPTINITRS